MAAIADKVNLNESANGGSSGGDGGANGHLTLDVSKLKMQSASSTNINGLSANSHTPASVITPLPQRNTGGSEHFPSNPPSNVSAFASPVSFFNHSVLMPGSSGHSGSGLSKAAQANFATTLERMRFQRESMTKKPKPKDTPNCAKLNVMLDGKPLATMVMPKYEVSNANDPTKRDRMILRPDMEMQRLYHIEGLLEGILTPNTGIEIKEKKSVFKKTTTSGSGTNPAVSGQQITEWLEKRGEFINKLEASKYAERMMTAGYLIPEKIVYEDKKFLADAKTMYVFQSPLLWRSKYKRKPTDEEYAVFLIKYITKFGGQGDAKAEERLDQLATANHSKWDLISKAAKKQLEIMDKVSKTDSKVFFVQEFGFWKSFRPSVDTEQHGMDLELKEKVMYQEARDKEIALKKAKRTDQHILEEELKALEVLKSSEAHKRSKASAAVRSLAIRCDLFEVLDPFLKEPEMGNPWIKDDTSIWEVPRKAPTAPEVRIWVNSFSDLLKDPLGVKYFFEFLVREHSTENMKFWAQVENLHSFASTRVDFTAEAVRIFTEFIPEQAPQELNLPSSLKNALLALFSEDNLLRLPYDCFKDAQSHVYSLMAKDSYTRFINSDYLNKICDGLKLGPRIPAGDKVNAILKKHGVD